jgi:hypothetical protein
MQVKPMLLVVALGLTAVACARRDQAAAAADSARVADSVTAAQAGASASVAATRAPASPRRENLVAVSEETPGLLTQAKLLPIDAQHLAQTKYPEGVVKSGTIGRRAGDLVYTFEIQQQGIEGTELVLVNAMDGSILTTMHRDVAAAKAKPDSGRKTP